MPANLDPSLVNVLSSLSADQQQEVLVYAQGLKTSPESVVDPEERKRVLLELAGSIPPEDIAIMKQAIHDGCEQIDEETWR
jgi:hypothetical protein